MTVYFYAVLSIFSLFARGNRRNSLISIYRRKNNILTPSIHSDLADASDNYSWFVVLFHSYSYIGTIEAINIHVFGKKNMQVIFYFLCTCANSSE